MSSSTTTNGTCSVAGVGVRTRKAPRGFLGAGNRYLRLTGGRGGTYTFTVDTFGPGVFTVGTFGLGVLRRSESLNPQSSSLFAQSSMSQSSTSTGGAGCTGNGSPQAAGAKAIRDAKVKAM